MTTPLPNPAPAAEAARRLGQQTRRVESLRRAASGADGAGIEEAGRIRSLSTALRELAALQRDFGVIECKLNYIEALRLAEKAGDREGEIICAIHLGNILLEMAPLKDLNEAESWYFHALKVAGKENGLVQGKCYNNLGEVEHERYEKARAANHSREELARLVSNRTAFYTAALSVLPADVPRDRAVAENGLGLAMQAAGDVEAACRHYQEAVRYFESVGDHHRAAGVRFNIALILQNSKRFKEAMGYAQAALTGLTTCGVRADAEVQRVRLLIKEIERGR